MKKISLRALMFVQAIIAFCIPVYYHLMVVYKLNSNAPVWIAIILLAVVSWLKKNSDVMDEYAKKTVQIADAICFKAALTFMGCLLYTSFSFCFGNGSFNWRFIWNNSDRIRFIPTNFDKIES